LPVFKKVAKTIRYILGAVLFVAFSLLVFSFYGTGGAPSAAPFAQGRPQPDLPVVDYEKETSEPKDKARKEKGDRFSEREIKGGRGAIAKLPDNMEILPTTSHWWVGLSALPVDQSDVVIQGYIASREAHLSDDRTGIYSEFEVQVAKIYKDTSSAIVAGTPLTVNRYGGSVRFASGKIQKYKISRQDMPGSGRQYVLFLKKTAGGDLLILTGYELAYGQVQPLDGEDTDDPRSALPFAKYRGKDVESFLQEVRDAVAHPVTGDARP
jgi:hypothetical protein